MKKIRIPFENRHYRYLILRRRIATNIKYIGRYVQQQWYTNTVMSGKVTLGDARLPVHHYATEPPFCRRVIYVTSYGASFIASPPGVANLRKIVLPYKTSFSGKNNLSYTPTAVCGYRF